MKEKMITIYNLEVGQADCILVHCENEKKQYFNLLVDGAYKKNDISNELNRLLSDKEMIQGIVVTHIDSDHISGLIGLVEKEENYEKIKNAFLLFNKFDSDLISYKQAEKLEREFEKYFARNNLIKSYEESFNQELMNQINVESNCLTVKIRSAEQRAMEEEIDHNIVNITILGPSLENVKKFMYTWQKDEKKSEIINRSSILLLLEFDQKAIVLSGDGYFSDIKDKLQEIKDLQKINVVKAAHHGAKDNNRELSWLIKTYGVEHVFFTIDENKYYKNNKHPSPALLKEIKEMEIEMTCNDSLTESKAKNTDNNLCNYMKHQTIISLKEK